MQNTIIKNKVQRVNISLQSDLAAKLSFFAKEEKTPLATKALEYIKKGLEEDEDLYWTQIAETRYNSWEMTGKSSLSFEEVWQKHIPSDSCPS